MDKTISQEKCLKETLKSGFREMYLDVFRYSLNCAIGKFNVKTEIKKRYVKRKVKYVHGLTCFVLTFQSNCIQTVHAINRYSLLFHIYTVTKVTCFINLL